MQGENQLTMKKHELLKVAASLKELADIQIDAMGGNYDMENTDENWAFFQAAQRWGGDDPVKRPKPGNKIQTYDFLITSYLKHLIEEEAKNSP
jgi:hypothetical protein